MSFSAEAPQSGAGRPVLRTLLAALALLLCAFRPDDHSASESRLKSAFLYNFTRLVTWPANAFAAADDPFIVAVLGEDALGSDLDDALAGKTLDQHGLVVRRVGKATELGSGVHIVYARDPDDVAAAVEALRGRPVLVVGEGRDVVRHGAVVGLFVEETPSGAKLRFAVNPDAAARAGLSVSSKLLSLATIVRDDGSH